MKITMSNAHAFELQPSLSIQLTTWLLFVNIQKTHVHSETHTSLFSRIKSAGSSLIKKYLNLCYAQFGKDCKRDEWKISYFFC